jgi:DNA-binding XRE family transcriptional regulator
MTKRKTKKPKKTYKKPVKKACAYKRSYNEHRAHYLPEWKRLGKAIKVLRQHKGLTGAEVAKTLGKSAQYYGHFEQGYNDPRTMPTDCKIALAEALGVPYEVVWGD